MGNPFLHPPAYRTTTCAALCVMGCFLLGAVVCCGELSTDSSVQIKVADKSVGDNVEQLAKRFVSDPSFRRHVLEDSLVNKKNGYAQLRLANYDKTHWGKLPVGGFKTRPVFPSDLGQSTPKPDDTWTAMTGASEAMTKESLLKRGAEMFTQYPAQLAPAMLPILKDAQGPAKYGLWHTDSSVGGLVWVELPGGVYPALSCSSCHGTVDKKGTFRPGIPNHQIDIGKAKDDYVHYSSLFSTWGPGRVDVAGDGQNNPIVIADVRAVRFQRYLHRTANVKNSLEALAVRVETGLITAHRKSIRPARRDAFALAYYLWSLGDTVAPLPPSTHPGSGVFKEHCGACHSGPGLAGKPVPAAAISSPVASMPSAVRGTGKVQTISLRGVSDRGLLLYGGDAPGVDALLSPTRKKGGHYMGAKLSNSQRIAIEKYLSAL